MAWATFKSLVVDWAITHAVHGVGALLGLILLHYGLKLLHYLGINVKIIGELKMKELLVLEGGAIKVVEEAGVISLIFDESLGGGDAKGFVKGSGKIQLDGMMGLKLGEKLLNSHLPAEVLPFASLIEGMVEQAVAKL